MLWYSPAYFVFYASTYIDQPLDFSVEENVPNALYDVPNGLEQNVPNNPLYDPFHLNKVVNPFFALQYRRECEQEKQKNGGDLEKDCLFQIPPGEVEGKVGKEIREVTTEMINMSKRTLLSKRRTEEVGPENPIEDEKKIDNKETSEDEKKIDTNKKMPLLHKIESIENGENGSPENSESNEKKRNVIRNVIRKKRKFYTTPYGNGFIDENIPEKEENNNPQNSRINEEKQINEETTNTKSHSDSNNLSDTNLADTNNSSDTNSPDTNSSDTNPSDTNPSDPTPQTKILPKKKFVSKVNHFLQSKTPAICNWKNLYNNFCYDYMNAFYSTTFILIVEIFIFLYAFGGLAISADHMCNSMETLCDHWEIPEDVGGGSFMAFGNAIPEITVNAISTWKGMQEVANEQAGVYKENDHAAIHEAVHHVVKTHPELIPTGSSPFVISSSDPTVSSSDLSSSSQVSASPHHISSHEISHISTTGNYRAHHGYNPTIMNPDRGGSPADLGIGAILGSGLIAFLLIPAICVRFAPKQIGLVFFI